MGFLEVWNEWLVWFLFDTPFFGLWMLFSGIAVFFAIVAGLGFMFDTPGDEDMVRMGRLLFFLGVPAAALLPWILAGTFIYGIYRVSRQFVQFVKTDVPLAIKHIRRKKSR
jgi:hypothetical protein